MTTLYDELKAAGCETDSHESDLYVKNSESAREILGRFPDRCTNMTFFRSEIDGALWADIPFAYMPWWRAREQAKT